MSATVVHIACPRCPTLTRVRFAKLNTEEAPRLAARLGIRSIPTLVPFDRGREVDRVSGAMDARALVSWLARQDSRSPA